MNINLTTKFVAKILLASIFVITGIKSLFNFQGFVNMVKSKNIPMATIVATLVLALKIIAGLIIAFSNNQQIVRISAISLIVFTLMATYLFHNAYLNPGELTNMLKNLSLVGGLMLLI